MSRIAIFAAIAGLLLGVEGQRRASAQTTEGSRFDVVSVKRARQSPGEHRMTVKPNGIEYIGVTVFDCIKTAFGVSDVQILNAQSDEVVGRRYDIVAKAERSVKPDELRLMLRNMLAERFALRAHRVSKETRVYELRAGASGAKLSRSTTEGDSANRLLQNGVAFERTSMLDLAEFLAGLESINCPVVDRTAVPGRFDFTLKLSDAPRNPELGGEHAVFAWEAIHTDIKQVGLELRRARRVIDFVVIDRIGKPADN